MKLSICELVAIAEFQKSADKLAALVIEQVGDQLIRGIPLSTLPELFNLAASVKRKSYNLTRELHREL